jgi:hypothetical protein
MSQPTQGRGSPGGACPAAAWADATAAASGTGKPSTAGSAPSPCTTWAKKRAGRMVVSQPSV